VSLGGIKKTGLGLGLALLLVVVYLLVSWGGVSPKSAESGVQVSAGIAEPTIVDVHPDSAPPGGTVAVRFTYERHPSDEGDEDDDISALIAGVVVEALEVRGHEAVFRVPELAHGTVDLRLRINGRVSASRSLPIEPLNSAKIFRNIVGGLAFVVLGLLTLSRAFRHRAGATLRRRVGTLTRSMRSSASFGAAIGAVSQTSTLAAALALPSAERRLLSFRSAVIVVVAAHLGAVAVGAVLPLAATRGAPLVIAVGVILRLTASEKRGRATAKLITGFGLLLHGAHMLRSGFAPLAEQPSWLLELRHLDVTTLSGLILAALIGALAAFVAQGPGLVFVVVLSVSQATSFLGMDQALAILAGTAVGSAMSSTLVSWPLGQISRRVAMSHLILAAVSVVLVWGMLPWLPDLVATVLGTDPTKMARGKKILHPNVGLHLAVAFVATQWCSALVLLPAVPWLSKKIRPSHAKRGGPGASMRGPLPIDAVLGVQRLGLEAMQQALEGDASAVVEIDGHLERARELADGHLGRLGEIKAGTDTLVAILAVQQSLEQVRYTAARAVRRGVRVDPHSQGGRYVCALYELLIAGLDDAATLLAGGVGPDMDDLRTREIEINATEAGFRDFLRTEIEADDTLDSADMMRMAELANGYETVGNQLYRLGLSLVPDEF